VETALVEPVDVGHRGHASLVDELVGRQARRAAPPTTKSRRNTRGSFVIGTRCDRVPTSFFEQRDSSQTPAVAAYGTSSTTSPRAATSTR